MSGRMNLQNNDLELIRTGLPFWKYLSESEKNLIKDKITKNEIIRGTQLITGSSECSGLFLVKSGRIRAFIVSEEGREITLYRLRSNDVCIMSASCLMRDLNFTIYLEVEESGILYILPAGIYEAISSRNIDVKEFTVSVISEKFSQVMNTIDRVFFAGIPRRIAYFLLEQKEMNSTNILKFTHDDIAKNIGSVREVVSRTLKDFENKGIIKLSRGKLEILNSKQLENY